jgi:hypothetical protein
MKNQRKENSVSIETLIDSLSSNPDLFQWMVLGLWVSAGTLVNAAILKDLRDNYDCKEIYGEDLFASAVRVVAWPLFVIFMLPQIRIRLD